MKKRLFSILLATMMLLIAVAGNVSAAPCSTGDDAAVTCYAAGALGVHYAKTSIGDVPKHSGQSSYNNKIDVEVNAKVVVRYTGATAWAFGSSSKSNASGHQITKEITPHLDILQGAEGKTKVKCNVCGDVTTTTLAYKKFSG